jgi:exosortase/archaeosortase family protein
MRKINFVVLFSTLLTIGLLIGKGTPLIRPSLGYLQETGLYPYAVFGLCLGLLYSKREILRTQLSEEASSQNMWVGGFLIILAMIMPFSTLPFQLLTILTLWLGVFTAISGKIIRLPLALLAIYGFSTWFPLLLSRSGNMFPWATTIVIVSLLKPLIPISNQGQFIYFTDIAGGDQSYFINAACSGSASLGVFFSLLFLMFIDAPLPRDKAGYMFLFGLVGTTAQNLLRIVILVLAGYFFGGSALWRTHSFAGYILYPLWFALFAYIYINQARKNSPKRL